MTDTIPSILGQLIASLPLLTLKSTMLVIVAFALSVALRRHSASARHFVWSLALGASVVLAVIAPVAPVLSVPIARWPATVAHASPTVGETHATVTREQSSVTVATTLAPPRALSGVTSALAPSTFVSVWLIGVGGVLLWCAIGHLGLARLARGATPANSVLWRALLRQAHAWTGVRRRIRLGLSSAAGGPVTWGWRRPVILLPAAAASWPVDLRRVTLLHELGHVSRNDYGMQLVASLACALYWFNPLIWIAARQLRLESEHACDDLVLAGGMQAPEYASHLLDVARGSRSLRLGGLVAVSMARPSYLERRLRAVLDETRARQAISRGARVASLVVLAALVVPLAGMRPLAHDRSAPELEIATVAVPETERAALLVPIAIAGRIESRATDSRASTIGRTNAAVRARADSTFERTVDAKEGERLTLELETGGAVDLQGWDEPRVRVRAVLAGQDWPDTRVEIARTTGGVIVRAVHARRRGSQSTSHSFEIRVPRRFDVRLNSAGGGLTMTDVEGSFSGTTGGGALDLRKVRGRATLSTGGGDIEVSDSDLSGSVSTGGGQVRLSRVSGGLRGTSGSGPVIYSESPGGSAGRTFDATVTTRSGKQFDATVTTRGGETITNITEPLGSRTREGGLRIEKAGGGIDLPFAPSGASLSTGGGRITVGQSAGLVEAMTGGGDIEIGPVAGSVSASTGAGNVRVTLVDARGEKQSVEIIAGVGRVVVELPADFDGRIDLETGFTQRHGRETSIEAPWTLTREVTDHWDDSRGTPRRYVRATGVIGRGRGLVRVRTLNGDIVVRQASK